MVNWFSEKMQGQFNAETTGDETIWCPNAERSVREWKQEQGKERGRKEKERNTKKGSHISHIKINYFY